MRPVMIFLCVSLLALVGGCSTERVTTPELPRSNAGADALPGPAGPAVTLDDLKSGLGTGVAQVGPDVAITGFTTNATVFLPGDDLVMQAAVRNIGTEAAAGPFDVWIGVLGYPFEFARVTIDRLAPGESREGVVDFTVPMDAFAKSYPPGGYTLYCTHDFGDNVPLNNYLLADVALRDSLPGDIWISTTPDGLMAPWTLDGPGGFHLAGQGTYKLLEMPSGEFTVTWGDVEDYATPAPMTGSLAERQILEFNGVYDYLGSPETMRMFFADGSSCATAGFMDHLTAHIVYENSSLPSIRGFECGYDVILPGGGGDALGSVITAAFPMDGSIDVGVDDPAAGVYNRSVGFPLPYPTTASTVVATLDIFVLDSGEIDITLRAADPQSPPLDGMPKVVREDFSLKSVPLGYAPGSPALVINGGDPCGVVAGK